MFWESCWSLLYLFFLPAPLSLVCLTRFQLASGILWFLFLPSEQILLMGHHSLRLHFASLLVTWNLQISFDPQLPLIALPQLLAIHLDPI